MHPNDFLILLQQHANWYNIALGAVFFTLMVFVAREGICWFYKTNRILGRLDKVLTYLEAQEQKELWRKKQLLESAEDDELESE